MGVDYSIYLGPYAEVTVTKVSKGDGNWCSTCKQQQPRVDTYCAICGEELDEATKEEYASAWDIVPDEYEGELTMPLSEGYNGPIATFIPNDSKGQLEWCDAYPVADNTGKCIEEFKESTKDVFGAIMAKDECLSIEYKYGVIPYMW